MFGEDKVSQEVRKISNKKNENKFLLGSNMGRFYLQGHFERYYRELKHKTFLSTRTATRSDFANKVTSHVTEVKSQTSKLAIWRPWWQTKTF